jgi:hypothetical protein
VAEGTDKKTTVKEREISHMSIIAKSKPYQTVPDGTYLATIRGVWDVELQAGFDGGKPVPKIVVAFELEARRADGQRHEISEVFSLSTDEKSKLRPVIEALLGRSLTSDEVVNGVDVESLVGRCALVQVKNQDKNGKKYARIAGVIPLPSGTKPFTPDRDRYAKSELAKSLWERRIVESPATFGTAPVTTQSSTSVETKPVSLF